MQNDTDDECGIWLRVSAMLWYFKQRMKMKWILEQNEKVYKYATNDVFSSCVCK